MKRVFIDTGGWIAIAVRRDQFHPAAAAYARRLAEERVTLITTNYVLAETFTRIRYDDGHEKALQFDSILGDLITERRLVVAWVGERLHRRAMEIFRKYADQSFSVVDCASFVIARERKVREVFGFDGSFRTMGFVLKPGAAG